MEEHPGGDPAPDVDPGAAGPDPGAAGPGRDAGAPATASPVRPVRPLTVALAIAVLAVLGALVVPRLVDPYRPGTSHEVVVQHVGCLDGVDVRKDGHVWFRDLGTSAWIDVVPGTYRLRLDIVSDEVAVLHLPNGSEVRYRRGQDGAFSSLACAIA